ncbi:hypothetical protein [Piscirickettsia salmonis]|uniref:hypothetical protein n=1 Tax=Piscirickettsia salmonis TaxID=1238 RepID=UPI0007D73F56|nr:hypothetical protein A0O36_00596 [Piscirickettsiaceae bacterium NZ-RLO1]
MDMNSLVVVALHTTEGGPYRLDLRAWVVCAVEQGMKKKTDKICRGALYNWL